MRVALIVLVAAALSACAGAPASSPEPRIITQVVDKPVATSCVPPETPEPPAYSDTDAALKAAADAAARYLLLIGGREERDARLATIEPVVQACRDAGVK
jgi:hypothetical protein